MIFSGYNILQEKLHDAVRFFETCPAKTKVLQKIRNQSILGSKLIQINLLFQDYLILIDHFNKAVVIFAVGIFQNKNTVQKNTVF